ncbi:MAG: hemolysin family protein [Actinomycetota bacterium]
MSPVVGLISILALMTAGWVRAAGSAVTQIPRADAHHDAAEGVAGARSVAVLVDDRPRIGPSVGMVCSALLVVASVLAVAALDTNLGPAGVIALVAMVVLVGDVLPRLVGRTYPRPIAYRSWFLLQASVRLGGWAAERPVEENGAGSEEGEEPEEDEGERELISSVLRFSETIVREVMVPRLDMVTVDADAGSGEVAAAAMEHGFSRFPVTEGKEVVGILLVKDLLEGLLGEGGSITARQIMRPAVFVPEVKQIADLLAEMRSNKTHMSMVVDEFGDIVGLVTIEDLLEELVGEIADETDEEQLLVEMLEEGVWRVDARLSVDDLAELLDSDMPEGDWDTVGGLILGLAERVPEESERFVVDSAFLEVTRMQGRRVLEVMVSRQPNDRDEE